jgi:hypothetical protein
VAEGVGPEFKPQYWQKKKKSIHETACTYMKPTVASYLSEGGREIYKRPPDIDMAGEPALAHCWWQ